MSSLPLAPMHAWTADRAEVASSLAVFLDRGHGRLPSEDTLFRSAIGRSRDANSLEATVTEPTPLPLEGVSACVFDAYGTLFDFASAAARCGGVPEEKRVGLTALWRDKQLQYAWLRSLQDRYADFWQVTGDALDFALDSLGLDAPGLRQRLMELYLGLEPFPEVPEVLAALRGRGFRTAILSNGSPAMLETLVGRSGLARLFDAVLSVDAVGVFKTHPKVYQLALDALGLPARKIAFQSSNAWDAHGASDFGMRVVWCNRDGQRRERLPGAPDFEVRTLAELPGLLAGP